MELRKIEYKNADNKNHILVVESEYGSEFSVKLDNWHKAISDSIYATSGLVEVIKKILGVDFLFFSLTKKTPSKKSPFLFVLSFSFDTNLKGYESKTTVKDIEVNLEMNIKEAIEATEKRLGELDAYKEAEQIKDCQARIGHYQLFIELIDAVRVLEEAIADNWHEISESQQSKQLEIWITEPS